jgi:hypothetical protein
LNGSIAFVILSLTSCSSVTLIAIVKFAQLKATLAVQSGDLGTSMTINIEYTLRLKFCFATNQIVAPLPSLHLRITSGDPYSANQTVYSLKYHIPHINII